MEARHSVKRFTKRNLCTRKAAVAAGYPITPAAAAANKTLGTNAKHDFDTSDIVVVVDSVDETLTDGADFSSVGIGGTATPVSGGSAPGSIDLKFMDDSTSSSSCTSASPSSSSSVLRGVGGGGDQDESREHSPFDFTAGLVNGHQIINTTPSSKPVVAARLPPLASQPSRIPVPSRSSPIYNSSTRYKPPSAVRPNHINNHTRLINGYTTPTKCPLPDSESPSRIFPSPHLTPIINGNSNAETSPPQVLSNHLSPDDVGGHNHHYQRGSPELHPPPPPSPSLLGVSDTEFGHECEFSSVSSETAEREREDFARMPDSSYPNEDLLSPINRQQYQQQTSDAESDNESIAESVYHQPPKAADRGAASRLAKRLFNLDGFRITDVSKHLCKRNDFNQLVGEEFASLFDFSGQRLDVALRSFLNTFSLAGESQERERVLVHFSRRYCVCNPEKYPNDDICHTLVCALMLLNTDLHNQGITKKMSQQEFINNLIQVQSSEYFDREELKTLYDSIKGEPFRWPSVEPNMLNFVNLYYPGHSGVYAPSGAVPTTGYLPPGNLYANHPQTQLMLTSGATATGGGIIMPPTGGVIGAPFTNHLPINYYHHAAAPGSPWIHPPAIYQSSSNLYPTTFGLGNMFGQAMSPSTQLVQTPCPATNADLEMITNERKSNGTSSAMSPSINLASGVNAGEYLRGLLVRKWVMDSYGKKTSLGRRGWKIYYARLRDLMLCLYKSVVVANAATRAEELHVLHYQQQQQQQHQQYLQHFAMQQQQHYLLQHQQHQSNPPDEVVPQNPTGEENSRCSSSQNDDGNWESGESRNSRSTCNADDMRATNGESFEISRFTGDSTGTVEKMSDGSNVEHTDSVDGDVTTTAEVTSSTITPAAPSRTTPTDPRFSAGSPSVSPLSAGQLSAVASPEAFALSSTPLPPQPPRIPAPETVVRLAHAFASRATDYVKKANVFRLRTREGAEYLFEVPDAKDLDLWIDRINFVAALFSSPSMPCAVGSERSFYRPHLPVTYTRLNMREQLEEHQRRLVELNQDLNELRKRAPSTPTTSRRFSRSEQSVEQQSVSTSHPETSDSTGTSGDNSPVSDDTGTSTTANVSTSSSSNSLMSVFSTASLGRRRKSNTASIGSPSSSISAKQRAEYEERLQFTESEIQRYKTYARLLEAELFRLQETSFAHATALAHPFPPPFLSTVGQGGCFAPLVHPSAAGTTSIPSSTQPPPPRYALPPQQQQKQQPQDLQGTDLKELDSKPENPEEAIVADCANTADIDRFRLSTPNVSANQVTGHLAYPPLFPAYFPAAFYNGASTNNSLLPLPNQTPGTPYSPSVSGRIYQPQQQQMLHPRQWRGHSQQHAHQLMQLRHQHPLSAYIPQSMDGGGPVNGNHRLTEEEPNAADCQPEASLLGDDESAAESQTESKLKRHPSTTPSTTTDTTFYEFV